MAKARAADNTEHQALARDLTAAAFGTVGAIVLASLIYDGNALGLVPEKLSWVLRMDVGLGAYAVPVALFLVAAFYGLDAPAVAGRRFFCGLGLLTVALLVLLQVRVNADWRAMLGEPQGLMGGGGYVGAGVAYVLLRFLGPPAAFIVVVGLVLTGITLMTRSTARQMLEAMGVTVLRGAGHAGGTIKRAAPTLPGPKEPRPRRPRRSRAKAGRPDVELDDPETGKQRRRPPAALLDDADERAAEAVPARPVAEPEAVSAPLPEPVEANEPEKEPEEPAALPMAVLRPPTAPIPESKKGTRRRPKGDKSRSMGQRALLSGSDLFALPMPDMLNAVDEHEHSAQMREEAAEQVLKLEDTLLSFGINAKVTHYERGPVLTRYEVEPERGIRVSQVVRLADDLAMALAAVDVRVEAPIPGKSAIGIEVPNDTRATVSLRALIESDSFQEHTSILAFALGRDIAGQPVVCDIASMPHLLIAGATGSGKSVCLHSLIVSLLMRATPEDVRFIMVDPKRVELAVYDGIPHLMAPVVYSVKHAADVLRKAIREMEKRYDQFAVKGVVNLAEYNALAQMPKEHSVDEFDPLPHVVIVIDELADLMMQGRAEFEFSICRIAQLARATGIHLVLATQRPSVKVVTGNIKANVPSRVALSVASQVDSRTILDRQGAERLIGRGDMLYQPIDASKAKRVQGALVTRKEIERIVEHLQKQGEPEFLIIPEVQDEESDDFGGEMEASDELYAAAVQYVVGEQEASVSMIQRRFKVGYARAGRIVDMMEQRGVVGPHEGSKPRQVYIAPGMADAALGGPRGAPDDDEPIDEAESFALLTDEDQDPDTPAIAEPQPEEVGSDALAEEE